MLPKKITIHEVGPREGFQFEKTVYPTESKVKLINLLSNCNFEEIEVGSFVSPKHVPQMADAEALFEGIERNPATRYTSVFLNARGIERALAAHDVFVEGSISVTASETFSLKNQNRSLEDCFSETENRIKTYRTAGIPTTEVSVMAAFGCNYEGEISREHVVRLIDRMISIAETAGQRPDIIQLADTMGWADPLAVKNMIAAVREKWPSMRINLHMHDTRGCGVANIVAAMEEGVDDFDSSVGGLGGCPFAKLSGAAGNVCTEDLVHMVHRMGVDTGIDLGRLLEASSFVSELLGRPPVGKVLTGGVLETRNGR